MVWYNKCAATNIVVVSFLGVDLIEHLLGPGPGLWLDNVHVLTTTVLNQRNSARRRHQIFRRHHVPRFHLQTTKQQL